ncbi:MAG: ASKHA domain-containing protein, partial [Planctomycetota bacterium]
VGPQGREVLACQYHVEGDLAVSIPTSSRLFEQKILSEGIGATREIGRDIHKKYITGVSAPAVFGLALDVGTSTVAAKLIDMVSGKLMATASAGNPQVRFGDDVVSRISYAESDKKLAELHGMIIDCINELIGRLCECAGIDADQIYEACIVGNTTMNHIVLKLPVVQLGQAPYKAYSLDAHDCAPRELGLRINASGNVHTVENIAGFVGSDTTAVALATEIDSAEAVTLAVDIGTNGELVLAAGGKLYAASCAAGPAFEGARIGCGSRAVDGAIQGVVENDGDIDLDVIAGGAPRSICGSGLIDAVAVMLDFGIIDGTGKFVECEKLEGRLPAAIFSRIIEQEGQAAFVLARAEEGGGQEVFLTQADIRQVQLAKGAIRAGITLLQRKVGLADSNIERILLAGAFGNYIRRESALRIGLLPAVAAERIYFVGNAACSGAQMALVSSGCRSMAGELARKIQYVEIAHEKNFSDVFAESMAF